VTGPYLFLLDEKGFLKKRIRVAKATCKAGETKQSKPVPTYGGSNFGAAQFTSHFLIYLFNYLLQVRGRASSVGIETGYGLYGLGLFPDKGIASSPALGPTHPCIGGYFSRCEAAGHEADTSPPTNVEVNNRGAIPAFSHKSS
jgi:hypothetical protein